MQIQTRSLCQGGVQHYFASLIQPYVFIMGFAIQVQTVTLSKISYHYQHQLIFNLTPTMYAEIDSRSGLARKHMVSVFNRIIDPNYRGILYNLVYNNSSKPFRIKSADKIAQIIFSSVPEPCIQTTTDTAPFSLMLGGGHVTGP